MTLQAWSSALDDFEQTLAEQRAAVAGGRAEHVLPYQPPAGLGPLPRELLTRAQELLRSSQALTDALRTAASTTSRELAMLGRMRPSGSTASYVDHSV